ncbi:MAG: hypothetical protein ACOYK6_00360 [Chthoniobacterales bacterium]
MGLNSTEAAKNRVAAVLAPSRIAIRSVLALLDVLFFISLSEFNPMLLREKSTSTG